MLQNDRRAAAAGAGRLQARPCAVRRHAPASEHRCCQPWTWSDDVRHAAGVDPHKDDALGRLSLTDEGLFQRDLMVRASDLPAGAVQPACLLMLELPSRFWTPVWLEGTLCLASTAEATPLTWTCWPGGMCCSRWRPSRCGLTTRWLHGSLTRGCSLCAGRVQVTACVQDVRHALVIWAAHVTRISCTIS